MTLWKDIVIGLRQLRKSPGFTLVVLATLGLCIGVNTAIYSVLDAVLLRPAPYPQPDRLAMVVREWWQNGVESTQTGQTGTSAFAVREGASLLDVAVCSGGSNGVNFTGEGHLEYIRQQRVSTGFFRVMGVPPQYGREFLPVEDVPNGAPVVVLSYDFWKRIYNGDPAAVGRAMTLRGMPYTIVGVMPEGFRTQTPADVWTPLRPSRTGEGGGINYTLIARLKPGVSWAQANQQLKAVSQGMMAEHKVARGAVFEMRAIPIQNGMTQSVRSELMMTWAAVAAVLLIGCVNIAGLLLARSSARAREIATRLALGGSRAQIVRQLLVESLLLAMGGAVAGVGVGAVAIVWLKRLGAKNFELWRPIQVDGRVMLAMLAIAVVTSLMFGLVPALSTVRVDLRSALQEGGRGNTGGRRRWPRQAVVAGEVALTLVLLVSAGLLLRTLDYLGSLKPGFDPHNVYSAEASVTDARYRTSAAVNRLFTQTLDGMRRIPGVHNAAVALSMPYERPINDGFFMVEGEDRQTRAIEVIYATPGYFETVRIPVLHGREFRESDTADAAKVVVVSEAFADKYFHGTNALGHHIGYLNATREIVGIVGDIQQHSGIANLGPLAVEPTLYLPPSQVPDQWFQLIHTWVAPKWVIRASGSAGALAAQMQEQVASVDPQLPIARFQTVADLQARVTSGQRYDAALFSTLAGLALLLAAIGLYGLISQSINQRTYELGIRMALGATAQQAMGSAVQPGIVLAVAGIGAGYILSRIAVRFLDHLLFGVRSTDELTFVTMAAVLLLVAGFSSFAPALRILRLDPARTLRNE